MSKKDKLSKEENLNLARGMINVTPFVVILAVGIFFWALLFGESEPVKRPSPSTHRPVGQTR